MALKLPRLQRLVEIVSDSKPTLAFHRWWDSVATAIEDQVSNLLALIARVTVTESSIAVLEARNLTAGAGLTGGGTLAADRTFDVGAGTGIAVDANAVRLADTAVTPGAYGSASSVGTFTVDQQGRLTAAANAAIAVSASAVTGADLTKTDDANVTLTLGGTPVGALLKAVSLTLGWTGLLSVARGGTGVSTSTGSGANVQATQPQFTNTIGVGTAAINSGSGVSFPATQSASTDPNTLDDYEEGTWTPTVTALSGSITTYSASGIYTKIGRVVTATALVTITTNGTAATGLVVTLPFAVEGGFNHYGTGREAALSFAQLQIIALAGTSNTNVLTYNNGYPGGSGASVQFTVSYFV
jgi:hypothetical protein